LRDIRRVLFSSARYTVLARVSRDDIQSEWTPVKLVELLKDVVPDLAATFDGRGLLGAIQQAQAETPALLSSGSDQALVTYGDLLSERYGAPFDAVALASELRTKLPQPVPFGTVPEQRVAFEVVTEWVKAQGEDLPDEPEVLADLREAAMAKKAADGETSKVIGDADASADPSGAAEDAAGGESVPLLLDTEVVAIYW
jgi:hypothetical protein